MSRGLWLWWNGPKPLGDVTPFGKKPKVGDDGGAKNEEGIIIVG